MAAIMPLHYEAREALRLNQRETAEFLKLSKRTVQRWDARRSHPTEGNYASFAKAVFPTHPALAARLAAAAGTTLEALGLVVPVVAAAAPPPPAPRPPPPPLPPIEYVIDSVVCAAAVAMDMKPPDIRPALVAAFTRVRQLGLTAEAVEKALVAEEVTRAKPKK
jgi:hypothetical protein